MTEDCYKKHLHGIDFRTHDTISSETIANYASLVTTMCGQNSTPSQPPSSLDADTSVEDPTPSDAAIQRDAEDHEKSFQNRIGKEGRQHGIGAMDRGNSTDMDPTKQRAEQRMSSAGIGVYTSEGEMLRRREEAPADGVVVLERKTRLSLTVRWVPKVVSRTLASSLVGRLIKR